MDDADSYYVLLKLKSSLIVEMARPCPLHSTKDDILLNFVLSNFMGFRSNSNLLQCDERSM